MVSRLFSKLGEWCASHPWEVIVATLTLAACILTLDQQPEKPNTLAPDDRLHCQWHHNCIGLEDQNAVDMIIMTAIRCLAVLYSYYQFCRLQKLGSKYILGIAGLFTVFSSFVFSSSVINFLGSDISDLKDALFFFLLLIDLSKATQLAQFALSSRNQDEVKHNIARGMGTLGPILTLDTIVETLVIGVGTLSGVHRLETLCYFACMSVVVNYVVFMSFYPACLSLILELSRATSEGGRPVWYNKAHIMSAINEQDQKPNPVVQRVKVIMSAGLMLVHAHSRLTFSALDDEVLSSPLIVDHTMNSNRTDDVPIHGYIMKWLTVSADQIVILILLLALAVKIIFFEEAKDKGLMSDRAVFEEDSPHLDVALRKKFTPLRYADKGCEGGWVEVSLRGGAIEKQHKEVQTEQRDVKRESPKTPTKDVLERKQDTPPRSLEECKEVYQTEMTAENLTDEEVILMVNNRQILAYQLEKAVENMERGVSIRRQLLGSQGNFTDALEDLPYQHYDYSKVLGACCENVIGYMPIPLGVAGPLILDKKEVYVPMATTEGCLVASTNRGCRALLKCGINSRVVADGMTRGPVVRFPNIEKASDAMLWMQSPENFGEIKNSFDSTSRFARLTKLHIRIAGRHLFIRFVATTGDAMGMNMVSKGTEVALKQVKTHFPDMELLSLSGNFCTDKKPAAVNWIEGRGKSVVCEATVPAETVRSTLKTSVHALVDLNITKNMMGSAMAGSIGGFNAHAANIVTAIFIATGQDPAQNIASSNCMTLMEPGGESGEDLYISCTMPSIEIGTIGGGTVLPPQSACLEMLRVKGANLACPGENASNLARIVCGTVLAGELSLMSALAAGHLVNSHLKHNRSTVSINASNLSNFGAGSSSSPYTSSKSGERS